MKKSGFTLIEFMVVIAIIGILAAAIFPAYTQYRERANRSRANTDLRDIQKAILQLVIDTGKTPFGCTLNTWDNHEGYLNNANAGLISKPTIFGPPPFSDCPGWTPEDTWAGPYIQNLGTDPWGTNYYFDGDYHLCINGVNRRVSAVISHGPNKAINYPNCVANGITDDIYIKMEL